MILLIVIALLGVCSLLTGVIAGRHGYDRVQFMIAGFISGPFAVFSAMCAHLYEPVIEDDETEPEADGRSEGEDPMLDDPATDPSAADDIDDENDEVEIDDEASEGTSEVEATRPAPPPVPPPPPPARAAAEPQPLSLVDLAKLRPTTTVRTSLVEGDLEWKEPKRSRLSIPGLRGDEDEEVYEEFELTPVAPGAPSVGVCPHCDRQSYADWYGLCVYCDDVFPVGVPAQEVPEDAAEDDAGDDQPAQPEVKQDGPKMFLGLELPRRDTPLKVLGITILPENRY